MKTTIQSHPRLFAISLTCVATFLLLSGCNQKPGEPSQPKSTDGIASQTETKIQSAEKTSFDDVTSHLDPGGSLYAYLGTRQWLEGLSGKVQEWRDVLSDLPDQNSNDRQKVEQAFDLITSLIRNSGIEQISGVGVSGIALEPGYYQTKMMVHHYPGAAEGYLWSIAGETPHPLDALNLLPADTVWASFGDLNPVVLWNVINKEVENSGLTEAREGLGKLDAAVEGATGSNLSDLLGSLGGQQGILLTLDQTKTIQFPLPQGNTLQIPEPALLIAIKVRDDTLFDLIESKLKEMPQVAATNANGLRTRTLSVPVPVPVNLKPTIARYADYLFIASNDEIVQKVASVQAGETLGLKTASEFQRLAKGMPTKGNQFTFVSQRLSKTIQDVQTQMMNSASGSNKPGELPLGLIQKLSASGRPVSAYNVGANTDQGWLMVGHGNQEPATMVAAPLLVAPAAIVAGMALPAFAKAKDKAQSIACINNLKQIGVAAHIWADAHDGAFPADFVSMKKELATPRVLFCPRDKFAPKPSSVTWENLDAGTISYEFVSPGLKVADADTRDAVLVRCPIHGHKLMGDGRVERGD